MTKHSSEEQMIFGLVRRLYVDSQLSTTQIPEELKKSHGIEITQSKCYGILKEMGVLRSISEAVSIASSDLDYSISHLDERMTGIIEGMLIGDGTIACNENTKVGRLSISGCHKEFISYCRRLLKEYSPCEPVYSEARGPKGGSGMWITRTKFHPDFYSIHRK